MGEVRRPGDVRVLLVDDDRTAMVHARRILASLRPEAKVDEAASAVQAVAMLREHAYDLILADYYMAWMNGIELLEVARDEQPQARRVLVTGRERDLAEEGSRRAEIHGFVQKPVSAEKLATVLAGVR